jgi:predicted peptidase
MLKWTLLIQKNQRGPYFLQKSEKIFYQKKEAVDNKRIYILGLSLLRMSTFDMISRFPTVFAAAIPILGCQCRTVKKSCLNACQDFQYDSEHIVSPEHSRNAFIELKADGL